MARQVLPIVGAVIGAYFGNPQLGYAIGALIGNAVDPQVISGPKLGEAGIQTSAEGVFRPIVFGTAAIKGNVIARGNRVVRTQRDQQSKGGGPVTETDRVYWTYAIRLTEGEIAGVTRIWEDEKLVYDIRPESVIPSESADYANRFRLYLGTEDQLPDPDLEAFVGIGNTPAYRGTSYVVFPNSDLTDRRESIPDYRFEVITNGEVFTSGKWMYGPVSENGSLGGPQNFIKTADNPEDLPFATPTAIPAWMPSIARISTANGAIFLHGTGANPGAVSFDGGATFTQTSSIGQDTNVTWSGQRFYCRFVRSLDGITWESIPNLPATPSETVGGSGLVISFNVSIGQKLQVSTDEAASWTGHFTPNDWQVSQFPVIGQGGRIHYTLDSVRAFYSDDNFVTQIGSGFVGRFYSAGNSMVLGRLGTDIVKSIDNGVTYQTILTSANFGASANNIFAMSEGIMVVDEVFAGSPQRHVLKISTNGGQDWNDSADLWGAGTNIVFSGGGSSGSGNPVSLSSIVSAIHDRSGQDSSFFDVTELTDMVDGLVLAGDYTCGDAIRTLMPLYFFDAPEYDDGTGYKIRYHKRGKPVVATLDINDLIDAPEKTVRASALERAKTFHLHYESPKVGYVPAKATVTRNSPDVKVVGEVSVQVPVSFKDTAIPRQLANKLHKISWVEVAGEEEFTVGDNWLELIPSDNVGVSLRGQLRRLRITQDQTQAGIQPYKMIADRQSAYTSSITGIPLPDPTPPPPSLPGQTIEELMDLPALNDNNDRLLWYRAMSGQTEAWYGAQGQIRRPADTDFINEVSFTQNTIMGVLLDPITSASQDYTDTTNVVRIQLYTEDQLDSLTDQQFLSEGGSFALKNVDGSWEVLQYRDSVDEGNNVFSLSYLARGRLNTDAALKLPGSRFVLLDFVKTYDTTTSIINQDIDHRAVSFGTSPELSAVTTTHYIAKSQIEFPVAHLFLSRDTNTINGTTVPRHRFGTELNPVRSVNWVGYRWTATDGVNTASVDTIADATSFDVTGWSSPVTVTISQLNRFTGAGPSVSEQIA